VLGINYFSILKWKGLYLKSSLYCSEKSNNFHMPGRIPTAKVPELRVQPEFCDGAPFSLGFKRNRIIGTHIFLNYLESGRLKIRFWFLCF